MYEAICVKSNYKVAIKMVEKRRVDADETEKKLMKQELQMLQKLTHPYIVEVVKLLQDAEFYYIVCKLLACDLLTRMKFHEYQMSEATAACIV